MRKNINTENIIGYVYENTLEVKTVQNKDSKNYGKDFIAGEVRVAIDEDLLNVIPVHFTYVTETTASGNKNATYENLKRIIDEKRNVVDCGVDGAFKVRINTALALNDFYNQNNELVSTKVNEGGFVSIISDLGEVEDRNKFTTDMVIFNVSRKEADPEKNIDNDYVIIKGYVFNFRNQILPVEFKVTNIKGMEYFEDLDASQNNPVYTKVWGKIICNTIKTQIKEESAFGEAAVRTFERKTKDWVVTGCAQETYDFGEEDTLTIDELVKAKADRDLLLADTKKRSEEYRASRNGGNAATATSNSTSVPASKVPAGTFDF